MRFRAPGVDGCGDVVSVDAHECGGVFVAEEVGDFFDGYARRHQQRCRRVSHFVGRPVSQASSAGELLELTSEVTRVDQGSDLGAKDKVEFVPDVAVARTFLILNPAMGTQCHHSHFGESRASVSTWLSLVRQGAAGCSLA